jgi:hypothetical protein
MVIVKIIANIFWVYKYSKLDIPYTRTVLTVVGLVFMHMCQIALLFDIQYKHLLPFKLDNSRIEGWLNTSVILTPLIASFLILFKKTKLESFQIAEYTAKKWKTLLVVYFVISFLLLLFLLIRKGILLGTI